VVQSFRTACAVVSLVFMGGVITNATAQTPEARCDTIGIDGKEYHRLLNREFAALLSPQSGTLLGNFVGVDLKEAEASVAAASIFRNGNLLGIKASGGSGGGLLPILNGEDINQKFSAQVQLNLLSRREGIHYTNPSCVAYYRGRQAAFRADTLRRLEIAAGYDSTVHQLKLAALRAAVTRLRASADSASGLKKDSLRVEIMKAETAIGYHIADAVLDTVILHDRRGDALSANLRKYSDSLQVTGFSFGWVSIGYSIENTTFKHFNPSAAFADQVVELSDATHGLSVRYSHYTSSVGRFETRFWTIAATAGTSNNLGELKKTELVDKTEYGTVPNQRTSEKKYTALRGDFRDNLGSLTLSADLYQFLLRNSRGALHLYPVFTAKEHAKPTLDTGIGFLLTGKNTAKDGTPFANLELYWKFPDIFNTQDSEDNVVERSGVGLRLTFPINFQPEF
jgi:hypothetical protein